MNEPTKEEIKKFLEIFDKLSEFECHLRLTREYGAFLEGELPIPEVVKVAEWLREKAT